MLIVLLFATIQFQAQSNGRDFQKEKEIEKQLATADSLVVNNFRAGTMAMDNGDYATADSLYTLVLAKVPTFDPALRRLGNIRYVSGQQQDGIDLCTKAVGINRSAYNLLSLAVVYSDDPNKLLDTYELLTEARKLPDGDDSAILSLYAHILLQMNEVKMFRETVSQLNDKYPDDPTAHYYAAVLYAFDEEWTKSKNEMAEAQRLGISQEAAEQALENLGVNSAISRINMAVYFGIIVGAWIVGLLLLFGIGKLLSNITIRSIENQTLTTSARAGGWLRKSYKYLINASGIYYYFSLPVILILVLALSAGVTYLFILAGRIPIQLTLALIVGAVMTIYSMVRSLLVKVKYTDPGRELKIEEAPALYGLAEEVANRIGTRPIDEIRITASTDLAVYEKGTWSDKLKDKSKRILILGTGVLKDFRTNEFKAILAHEYGHFSNRDTAGGEVAMRVQNDMSKYFYALYEAEQNTRWNIAFHFLRLYDFIFRRISHGSTRLHEVMADYIAARTFGAAAFEKGLMHVIKRDIEFNKCVNDEITDAVQSKRPLNNLYKLTYEKDNSVEVEVQQYLTRRTSEDDTHPSPVDRIRYTSGISSDGISENSYLVKDLFLNWDKITEEMTLEIEEKVERENVY